MNRSVLLSQLANAIVVRSALESNGIVDDGITSEMDSEQRSLHEANCEYDRLTYAIKQLADSEDEAIE